MKKSEYVKTVASRLNVFLEMGCACPLSQLQKDRLRSILLECFLDYQTECFDKVE